jgi:bacterioferritin-associated ferredoxin
VGDSRGKRRERRKLRRLRKLEASGITDQPRKQSTADVTDAQIIEWATVDTDCGQCYDQFNETVMKAKRAIEVHYKKHKKWDESSIKVWLTRIVAKAREDHYGKKREGTNGTGS